MTAQIVGFVSRADWDARLPRSVSHNIQPDKGGSAKHYGGSGLPPNSHDGCVARWKSWQDYHMDGRGWVDVAYTGGYCNHGYAFAGRGFGVRTAANGTNDGNDRFYAFVWIGGGVAVPTREALDALDWWFAEARRSGGAGDEMKNHRDLKSTSCPGDYLAAYQIDTGSVPTPAPESNTPVPTPEPPTPSAPPAPAPAAPPTLRQGSRGEAVKIVQRAAGVATDGVYGPNTETAVKAFQRRHGLTADGVVGPNTWVAVIRHPSPPAPPKAPPPPQPAPAPAAPAPSARPTLRRGASGDHVRHLQRRLVAHNYDIGSAGADGDFGVSTYAAVRRFQKNKGLTVDGVVGSNTWARLN